VTTSSPKRSFGLKDLDEFRQRLAALRLETGDKQTDALRLYYRYGFTDCGPFGHYAVLPPRTIAASIFLEKLVPPT